MLMTTTRSGGNGHFVFQMAISTCGLSAGIISMVCPGDLLPTASWTDPISQRSLGRRGSFHPLSPACHTGDATFQRHDPKRALGKPGPNFRCALAGSASHLFLDFWPATLLCMRIVGQ